MKKRSCLIVFFLIFSAISVLRSEENTEILHFVDTFLKESKAPGVQISIVQKGDDSPLTISRGTACVENDVPMSDVSVLKLGSITKLFTAIRIKLLIQEGKLKYTTPIRQYFPNFPNGEHIEIRHLLSHTSGVHEMFMIETFRENMCRNWTPDEVIDLISKKPPLFSPGTEQKYCNSGYLILGRIVEMVTGDTFENQIKKHIIAPLKMTHTQVGNDFSIVKRRACGYSTDKNGQLIQPLVVSMVPPFATGNFIGTSRDIVRFVYLSNILKDNFIDTPVLTPFVLDNGKSAFKSEHFFDLSFDTSYLNGFTLFKFHDRGGLALVGKSGMFPGFGSWFLYDPKTSTAIAVITNEETQCMKAMQLAVRIFEYKRKQRN